MVSLYSGSHIGPLGTTIWSVGLSPRAGSRRFSDTNNLRPLESYLPIQNV
jgi:hypothetical protein